MSSVKRYGNKTNTEVLIEDRIQAREIVQEILNFGVSQQQMLHIAYLLVLELEDRDAMITITESIKKFTEGEEKDAPSGILTT
tara:strand:+ start:1791 stop:2039 length:249 start_codon:yes stop_codon:yes gene_type:complete